MSSLESSILWAPVEAMTQVSRNSQKLIAKDMASIQTQLKSLQSAMPKEPTNGPFTVDSLQMKQKLQMTKLLQGMMKEVQGLKKKLEDAEKVAAKQAKLCSSRLYYLYHVDQLALENKNGTSEYDRMEEDEEADEEETNIDASSTPPHRNSNSQEDMEIDSTPTAASAPTRNTNPSTKRTAEQREEDDSTKFQVTPQLRLDRIFADQLLRSNRPATAALLLSSTPGLSNLVDTDIFAAARKIELSLRDGHDCTKALAWCGENRSRLNKIQSTLEFDLRLQEFLSLVQKKQPLKAIEYARKFLAPAAITTTPAVSTAPAGSSASGAALTPALERTTSLPERPPPEATPGLMQRNNSLGPSTTAVSTDDKSGDTAGSTAMVADPARVKILQEAMNLLVFFGFEQQESAEEEKMMDVSGNGNSSATSGGVNESFQGDTKDASPSVSHPSIPPAWHKYRVYFSPSRFDELVQEFHRTHLAIYGLPERSVMESVLNVGLSCLKTSSCGCTHTHGHDERTATSDAAAARTSTHSTNDDVPAMMETDDQKGAHGTPAPAHSETRLTDSSALISTAPPSCPACTYPLSCLSHSLPVAQRTHSRLVCRITGALMDDKNPPMALPNGYVYSKNALQDMAKMNNGQITCPRTKQQFLIGQAKIAYVL